MSVRKEASALIVGLVWFLGTIPVIFFLKYGVLDEMDFWAGTIGLVACSIIEIVLFAWVFGMDRGWEEMHRGADIRIPRVFYPIMKYVTPLALIAIFCWWLYDAVAGGSLVPRPKISWGVEDRDKLPGNFAKSRPGSPGAIKARLEKARQGGAAPEETARLEAELAAAEEFEALEKGFSEAAEVARYDLRAIADVELDAAGGVRVATLAADTALRGALDAPKLQRWLSLQGWSYREGSAPAPAKVTISIEVLHRAPYIWLARAIILATALAFTFLVTVAWRKK